jgi:riboflavin synthase
VFSGIVETTSDIMKIVEGQGQRTLHIRTPRAWNLRRGESVCIDGVCSTVQRRVNGSFHVTYMPETLRRSTLAAVAPGNRVNLERSLTLQSLLGGHLVQGHVDTKARIHSIRPEGDAMVYEFSVPRRYSRYMVEKGSIAIDGVSLTLVDVRQGKFLVSLLAYTLDHTTLGDKRPGQAVNVEVDVVAKYVERLLDRGYRESHTSKRTA